MPAKITKKKLTIGALAKAANVNIETIRYYQKVGLVIEPKKPANGFRYYPHEAITRVLFIKKVKELGFTLKQIKELLALGDGHCNEIQELANEKLVEIESMMKGLRTMRKALKDLVGQCESSKSTDIRCALVESVTKSITPK